MLLMASVPFFSQVSKKSQHLSVSAFNSHTNTSKNTNIRATQIHNYSYLKAFTGFPIAAFTL